VQGKPVSAAFGGSRQVLSAKKSDGTDPKGTPNTKTSNSNHNDINSSDNSTVTGKSTAKRGTVPGRRQGV